MDKKTILIGALACLIILGGIVLISRNSKEAAGVSSGVAVLSASETSFDFKEVSMAKGDVSHDFKIKNDGAETVTVTKIYTSCMCTEALLTTKDGTSGPFGMPGHGIVPSISVKLAPGEEATVQAVFNPAAHGPAGIGPVNREVIVENSGGKPLTLGFHAIVTP
jgi:hypothetical protein